MGKKARRAQKRRDGIAALLMNRLLQRIPTGDDTLNEPALEIAARDAVIAADLLIQELDAFDSLTREDHPAE